MLESLSSWWCCCTSMELATELELELGLELRRPAGREFKDVTPQEGLLVLLLALALMLAASGLLLACAF